VLLALAGGGALFMFLQSLQTASAKVVPPVNVVVAAKDLTPFQPVTADMLQIKSVPAEAASPEYARDVAAVVGKAVGVPVKSGQYIITSTLSDSSFSFSVPKGKRAMALWVDRLSTLNGDLRQGDKVDVIYSGEYPQINFTEGLDGQYSDPKEKGPTGKVVVQNVQVLKVLNPGDSAKFGTLVVSDALKTNENSGKTDVNGFWTVTLAVSDQEAEVIAFSQRFGQTSLVVRNSTDTATVTTTGVSEEILNENHGVPVPEQPNKK